MRSIPHRSRLLSEDDSCSILRFAILQAGSKEGFHQEIPARSKICIFWQKGAQKCPFMYSNIRFMIRTGYSRCIFLYWKISVIFQKRAQFLSFYGQGKKWKSMVRWINQRKMQRISGSKSVRETGKSGLLCQADVKKTWACLPLSRQRRQARDVLVRCVHFLTSFHPVFSTGNSTAGICRVVLILWFFTPEINYFSRANGKSGGFFSSIIIHCLCDYKKTRFFPVPNLSSANSSDNDSCIKKIHFQIFLHILNISKKNWIVNDIRIL